jgi:cytochrome P450
MTSENLETRAGELDIVAPEFTASPQSAYRRARELRVARVAYTGNPVICRYEDVVWALRHPQIFSSQVDLHLGLGTDRPMIPLQVDPPAQTRYRRILDQQFSRPRMLTIEPDVRRHANDLIDRFIARGECQYDEDFAIPLPCATFLRLMGLPVEDLDDLLALKDGIVRPAAPPSDLKKAAEMRHATGRQIYTYFEKVIEQRLEAPRDDLLTYLTAAEVDGEQLTRNEILDICYLLVIAGLDTVTASLGCAMAYLAANPKQRRRIAERGVLIPAAVEELLRWETPVMIIPRLVKKDVTVGSVELKAGEIVMLLLGSANTDDTEFGDAQRVDFERERNRHVAFGAGPHRCLGSHLARMELRVALEEWHRRIPDYEIGTGEVPRYSPGIREVKNLRLVWKNK